MSARRSAVVVAAASVLALLLLRLCTDRYFSGRGFPLDDAWIHQVYARSFARSATLAYNPGIASTGETAPLWALLLAVLHFFSRDPARLVVLTKCVGLTLHVATAVFAARLVTDSGTHGVTRASGGVLVALHPDLVAASVSGMEIPLATLLVCWITWESQRDSWKRMAVVSFLAPLARPELACIPVFLLGGAALGGDRSRVRRVAMGSAIGTATSFAMTCGRNLMVSKRPLPATFYAKFRVGGMSILQSQWSGFRKLLGSIAAVDLLPLLIAIVGLSVWLMVRKREGERPFAPTMLLASIGFFAVSFVLIPPIDAGAFYHQRYVLPLIPLFLAAAPAVVELSLAGLSKMVVVLARVTVLGFFGVNLLSVTPERHHRLENDAHNIDDVQVREGRALADGAASDVVWAVDAGAIRYFGNAYVVDVLGLNTPEMLRDPSQYLAAHPPRYVEVVPTWSHLDSGSFRAMEASVFVPSTPYTVTSIEAMAGHWLGMCRPPLVGVYSMRGRRFPFECARGTP